MKQLILLVFAAAALADYTPPPQRLARALDPAQVAALLDSAPAGATVSAPAALLRPSATNAVDAAIVAALRAAIADTRTNIAETAGLTDLQIAALYLAQMHRDVTPLVGRVPTNTVEYLIGAGMRLDLTHGDSTK
ncbi:MAG: hypothetical protein II839_08545 [Kiritimatiellae bacterium]|nr:hypothetical protein [Kiritimatiellia bacterium]